MDITFNGKPYYVTQEFNNKHRGTDYGTYRKNIIIYAIEDGIVKNVYKDSYGANCVKVYYTNINKTFTYVHLDKVYVKKNDKVVRYSKIGTTGMTGNATGIHLHLEIYDNKLKKYINPNHYNYEDGRKYIVKKGDNLSKIAKKYNTTWKKIYDDNKDVIGNNPNLIYPGQILYIY